MSDRCATCGAELPAGAMFCGECGRSVATSAAAPSLRPGTPDAARGAELVDPPLSRPSPDPSFGPPTGPSLVGRLPAVLDPFVPDPSTAPVVVPLPADVEPEPTEAEIDPDHAVCELCGTALAHDDIFCPECGHVASGVALAFSRQRDTAAIEPIRPDRPFDTPVDEPDPADGPAPRDAFLDLIDPPASDVGGSGAGRLPGRPVMPVSSRRDLEPARNASVRGPGERFLLQFSTGESVSVAGSGLIGRNPIPEPGESFDQLVRVFDPGRSVSKTHLEFGQEDGVLWLSDRFSGNGTVVSELGAMPRRAEAGRRVHIPRGTRVDIGEQFFIVS